MPHAYRRLGLATSIRKISTLMPTRVQVTAAVATGRPPKAVLA
jgi:hypothetical protein